MSCMENGCGNNENNGECARFFPDNIKELLKELVCDTVVIIFKNGTKERVRIECVSGNLLVVRDQGVFRLIDIDCICQVCVNAETILNSLIGHCDN